jgi:SAM-dependent methyltransferase
VNINSLKKKIKLKLLCKLLSGNNVACNICNRTFSSFIPYLGRVNAQCPNCGSLERTRLLYQFIKDKGLVNNTTRVLHIAPEKSLYRLFNKQLGSNYVPADKFEPGYAYPKGTRHVDVTDIGLPDESFDAVICIHVLEHVQEDAKAISEMYRVLKKGGFALLQVPYEAGRAQTYEDPTITAPEERRKHFLQFDHVRIYGRDYIDRFLKPGFQVEYSDYRNKMDQQLAEKLVVKNEEIFLLRK